MKNDTWRPCWKLTGPMHTTYNGTKWKPMVANPKGVRSGRGGLCSPGFYHAYDSPYLALLLNPVHANIQSPILWQAEWRGKREDDNGLKFGAAEMRVVRIVDEPIMTSNQRVAFAILCAAQVLDETLGPTWHDWAARWLDDRSLLGSYDARNEAFRISALYYAADVARYAADAALATTAGSERLYVAWAAQSAAKVRPRDADMLESALAWALALVDPTESSHTTTRLP